MGPLLVEMIGWIAPWVSFELIPPSGPPFDAGVIAQTAHIHERAAFDRMLIGYFSDAPRCARLQPPDITGRAGAVGAGSAASLFIFALRCAI